MIIDGADCSQPDACWLCLLFVKAVQGVKFANVSETSRYSRASI